MADSDQTITAKFIADTSGFTKGADEVVASSKAIEASTATISSSTGAAAGGLTAMGSASSKSAQDADMAVASFLGLSKSSESTGESLKSSAKSSEDAGGGFNLLSVNGMMAVMMFAQMVQMVGQALGALAKATDAANATAMAFTYLTGSATKAQQELQALQNTAAAKDFGAQAVDNVAQRMLMLGKDADTTNKEIGRVADAIAAMGGSASQIEPVIESLHKVQSESVVTKDDIDNIAKEGVPAWQMIADAMTTAEGKTVSVAEAQKRVVAGALSGKQAYQDMMEGMIQYTGAAETQSQSLGSEWQRLGEHAANAFKPIADWLAKDLEAINELIEGTSKLSDALKAVAAAMSGMGGITMSGFASGVIDNPVGQLATVGENGPETMFIPQHASIFPNGMNAMSALSGGGSTMPSLTSVMGSSGGGSGGDQPITIIAQLHVDGRQMAAVTIPFIAPMTRGLTGGRR